MSKAKTKIRKHRRVFLNDDEGMAAIGTSVVFTVGTFKDHKTKKEKPYTDMTADITISDCNRMVTLDFSPYNKETVKKLRRKLHRLMATLEEFEKDWEEQAAKVTDRGYE